MGWLKKHDVDADKEDKKIKREAQKMFKKGDNIVEVATELDLDFKDAEEYYKEWFDAETKSKKLGIEQQRKLIDLNEEEKQVNKKKTKKKDHEGPFKVYKMIRREPNSRKYDVQEWCTQQWDEEPSSWFGFQDFVRENGNGTYYLVDGDQHQINTFYIKNQKIDDPSDLDDDEDDDYDPQHPYQPPMLPPHDNGGKRGRGKKGKHQQQYYNPYYNPAMQPNLELMEQQVAMAEQSKLNMTTALNQALAAGNAPLANYIAKILEKQEANLGMIGIGEKDDDKQKTFKEELRDFKDIADVVGWEKGGGKGEPEKIQEIKAWQGMATTVGDKIGNTIKEITGGGDIDDGSGVEEMMGQGSLDAPPQQPRQYPALPAPRRDKMPQDPPDEVYTYDPKEHPNNIQGGGDEYTSPAVGQPGPESEFEETDEEDIMDEEEDTEDFDELETIKRSHNKPVYKMNVEAVKPKNMPSLDITKLGKDGNFIINKMIPRWYKAWKKGKNPDKLAVEHFGAMFRFPLNKILKRSHLEMILAYSQAGAQHYIDTFKPYYEKFDPSYKCLKLEGEKGLASRYKAAPDWPLPKLMKVLKTYRKIRPMAMMLMTEPGKEWFDAYLTEMVRQFKQRFGKKPAPKPVSNAERAKPETIIDAEVEMPVEEEKDGGDKVDEEENDAEAFEVEEPEPEPEQEPEEDPDPGEGSVGGDGEPDAESGTGDSNEASDGESPDGAGKDADADPGERSSGGDGKPAE